MSKCLAAALTCAALLPLSAGAQNAAKIQNAVSAAPMSISGAATVMDWDQTVLREGTNAWTCFPDFPETEGNDPMCLDEVWLAWADAYMNKKPFKASRIGFGYMLGGDSPASNTDPWATGPTPDNEWLEQGVPHIMILVPDASALKGLPMHPKGGGPWIMWRGTPYVHVMAPVADAGSSMHGMHDR